MARPHPLGSPRHRRSPHSLLARIARDWLGADAPPVRLGSLDLHPHQRDAVARLRLRLHHHGGALLADEPGLGKTHVAIALAREAKSTVIVAPAALRHMWRRALADAGVPATVHSMEALGRPNDLCASDGAPALTVGSTVADAGDRTLDGPSPLVIVDEAHGFRNPRTRRYATLTRLTTGARVLLLSATPVHNRPRDLSALLALFLGARAYTLTDADRSAHLLRRDHRAIGGASSSSSDDRAASRTDRLPHIMPLVWLPVAADRGIPTAIFALPPPVPPADGGEAAVLVARSLVRQWASSVHALRVALRRRLALAHALSDALLTGRLPSRVELRAWTVTDGALQLAFPELMATVCAPGTAVAPLARAVAAHRDALQRLLAQVAALPDADDERARLLLALADRHPGEKIVAFASYGATVAALYARLRHRPAVALLRRDGALVAGGRLTRAEALERFAPVANGVASPRDTHRIDLLLATDLLSEGVNLQDAAVVVHLDLPWTAARLEQRVGRVARLGSAHARVLVFALAPPPGADAALRLLRHLAVKRRAARRAVGGSTLLERERTGAHDDDADAGDCAERVRAIMRRWLRSDAGARRSANALGDGAFAVQPEDATVAPPTTGSAASPPIVTLRAARAGLLALCRLRGSLCLVGLDPRACDAESWGDECALADCISDAACVVARVAREVDRAFAAGAAPGDRDCDAGDETVDLAPSPRVALAAVERWMRARRAADDAGASSSAATDTLRRRLRAQIAGIVSRAAPHERAVIADRARRARRACDAPRGIGSEVWLVALAAQLPEGSAGSRDVGALGDRRARDRLWLDRLAALPVVGPDENEASGGLNEGDRVLALVVLHCPARRGP